MDKIGSKYRTPSEGDEQSEDTQLTYRRSRRRRVTPYRYQPDTFYPDEHPEIPTIRRASLQPNAHHAEKTSHQEGKKPALSNRTHNNRQRSSLKDRLQILSHSRALLIVGILVILILTPIMITSAVFNTHPSSTSRALNQGTPASTSPASNRGTPAKATAVPVNQRPTDPHQIVIVPSDTDHPPPPVFAQSAYLLDADTGVTLYAYNPFKHIPMLSTTKLMTAVIALEIGNPAQKITITNAIANDINQLSPDSSLFGVKKGETYTLSDLLYGLLLPSGNDAGVVIADALSGNIKNFVAKMNQKALQLGMYDTHYMNPHGLLQPGHYSSAHDLAVLGRYSMSIPLIRQITGTRVYHLPAGKHPDRILLNGNQFLWWYPGVDGGKPGWDAATNFLQVISCTRNHHHLIGVVMHSNNFWTDMRDLLNWGFNDFTWISPHDVDFQHPIIYDSDSNYFASDRKENTIPTADKGRYYIYTGFSISGPIMAYFDRGGGLKKFGYPISLPSLSSAQVSSQRFQHATIHCNLTTKQCTAT